MKSIASFRLRSGRSIGPGQPCFIVAEIGNNHQGNEDTAREMITQAARAGVDAVKFQKRDTRALLTRAGRQAPYTGPNSFGPTYGEHRQALELPVDALARLRDHARSLGLEFFASAWDAPSMQALEDLDVELIKIASADLTSVPLLRQAAQMKRPVILSTGMSEAHEIKQAVAELRAFGCPVVLMHCNSAYPCPDKDTALPAMQTLGAEYGLPVGYSGHEQGLGITVGAVALGACVVERHFTLDRALPGTDHAASLTPDELTTLTAMIRELEAAMGQRTKTVTEAEKATAKKLRKSITTAVDIKAGEIIDEHHLTIKSPGTGLSPLHWDAVLGTKALRDLSADELLQWEDLEPEAHSEALP